MVIEGSDEDHGPRGFLDGCHEVLGVVGLAGFRFEVRRFALLQVPD